jgi:hypothetical protein
MQVWIDKRSTIREISEALDWREGNVLGSMYRIEKKFKNLLFVEKVFEDGRFKTRYSIKE